MFVPLEYQHIIKLLFITDPAVIPFPDLDQKIAMADYAIEMANRFGVDNQDCLNKRNGEEWDIILKLVDYSIMCKMADR